MKLTTYSLLILFLISCNNKENSTLYLSSENFVTTIDGHKTGLYTLKNANGMQVDLCNYGARIAAIYVPDNQGEFRDVIWGFASIQDYIKTPIRYANPIIGRVANRIKDGQFILNNKHYQLSINSGAHHLHGGKGIEVKVWDVEVIEEGRIVKMTCFSANGEDGYPGNMTISVTYTLDDTNALSLDYTANSDSLTIVNLTSHAMFNLSGNTDNNVLLYEVQINALSFLEMDADMIPNGKINDIKGTPLDFLEKHRIAEYILSEEPMIANAKGYDHYFIFDPNLTLADAKAEISCPESGIKMTLYTDQLGAQLYTGNFFNGSVVGKRNNKNNYRSVFALEAQGYPDAPNHASFPSIILQPSHTYTQHTTYAFSVVE